MKVCRVQMYVVYIEGEGEGKAEKEKEGEEKREGKSTPLNASRVRSSIMQGWHITYQAREGM